MRRSMSILLVLAALALCAGCQTIRPSGASSGRTPVLFVHGWNADETTWNTAVDTFKTAGYTSGDITVIYYDTSLSAKDAAAKLVAEVDYLRSYTGKSKIDIVSHSFGSMVTKYCIELGDCAGKVSHWMSLAGADNGTTVSAVCSILGQASCKDMNGETTTINDLKAAWPNLVSQGVKVMVQWSPNDGTIAPATNSQEPSPAVNVELTGGQAHLDIPKDAGVLQTTLAFLAT